jgi:TP901 family phage tail tape measure protein
LSLGKLPKEVTAVSELTQQTSKLNHEMEGVGNSAGKALGKVESVWSRLKSALGFSSQETEKLNSRLKNVGGGGLGQRAGAFNNAVQGAVSGATFLAPLEASADYDFKLRHTAITEGLSGADAEKEVKRLGAMFNKEALETGQSSNSIAAAFQDLIQSGLTKEQAEGIIGIHSRAATAYGIDPEAMGHAVFAMRKNLGVDETTMKQALAGLAQASKEGLFKMGDFSTYLTGQSGQAKALGMSGLKGVADLAAMNEVVSQRTTDPAQAGQWVASALGYINTPATAKSFKQAGIDLNGEMRTNMAGGMNQFDSFLKIITDATKGLTGADRSQKLGAMFGRGEERQVWQAILDQQAEFEERRQKYANVDPAKPDEDFNTAFQGVGVQMTLLKETTLQITREFGDDFVPVLRVVNTTLGGMLGLIRYCRQEWPEATHYILLGAGAFLVLAAALAVVGLVATPVAAAMTLITWPILLVIAVVALLALAAYELYEHWGAVKQFFIDLWNGVVLRFKQTVSEFAEAGKAVVEAIKDAFNGVLAWFEGLWSKIAASFTSLVMGPINKVRGWIPGLGGGEAPQPGAAQSGAAAVAQGTPANVTVPVTIDHPHSDTTVSSNGQQVYPGSGASTLGGMVPGLP